MRSGHIKLVVRTQQNVDRTRRDANYQTPNVLENSPKRNEQIRLEKNEPITKTFCDGFNCINNNFAAMVKIYYL